MEYSQLGQIVAPLLAWYGAGHRQLPWRETKDPYKVWVSEIMLQQTRVETVIPYYQRFMERCPDVAALAACEDGELLKLWEGLGYYSRVRNLKKAAQVICASYGGKFPETYEAVRALPGIGDYTAGAITSIAFGQARAAVDGNVLRVVTRLTQDGSDIMENKVRRQVTEALENVYSPEQRGDFTQSLMELGAVVCVPNGAPLCGECPLNALCGAYKQGTQMQYPVKKKKPERKIENKTVLLLLHQGQIALRKRGAQGILAGMWELPNIDGVRTAKQIRQELAQQNIALRELWEVSHGKKPLKHIFTHREWHMVCWAAVCSTVGADNGLTWVTEDQLAQEFALPTAFKKCLEWCGKVWEDTGGQQQHDK